MIVVRDVEQGTIEWLQLRTGIPTASRFDQVITPKTMQLSKSADRLLTELVTERLLGFPLTFEGTDWMERGSGLEAEARRWYGFTQEVEVEQVGFCFTDDKSAGCSPDGLVGENGGLEIKCPSAHVHVGHLLGRGHPASETQVQGSLYVTGRKWWDVLSYCPGMPPVLVRVQRDEEFIEALGVALTKFNVGLDTALRKIQGMGAIGRVEGFGEDDALISQLYASVEEPS